MLPYMAFGEMQLRLIATSPNCFSTVNKDPTVLIDGARLARTYVPPAIGCMAPTYYVVRTHKNTTYLEISGVGISHTLPIEVGM